MFLYRDIKYQNLSVKPVSKSSGVAFWELRRFFQLTAFAPKRAAQPLLTISMPKSMENAKSDAKECDWSV